MTIRAAGLALGVTLAACAPSAASYENVRITSGTSIPVNCNALGEVSGGGEVLSGTSEVTAGAPVEVSVSQDPLVSLRQATADLGGDTVVIGDANVGGIGATIVGEAYDCSGYNPQR